MTFGEAGLLVAVIFGVAMLGAYVVYRMGFEAAETVRRLNRWLNGKRGDRR